MQVSVSCLCMSTDGIKQTKQEIAFQCVSVRTAKKQELTTGANVCSLHLFHFSERLTAQTGTEHHPESPEATSALGQGPRGWGLRP